MPFISFNTEVWRNKVDPTNMTLDQLLASGGEALAKWKRSNGASYIGPVVRRPLDGLEIKERTPVNLSVLRNDGTPIMLNNMLGGGDTQSDYVWLSEYSGAPEKSPVTGAPLNSFYTDFSIFNLQESREERIQVVETFGEDFVFFFGERPRFLSLSGVLVNSRDYPWRAIWWENYDKYLRGTKCVENRARVYLAWDDVLLEGYIISAAATDSSSEPHMIPFNFTMLLTKHTSLAAANIEVINASNALTPQSSQRGEILGSIEADVKSNNVRVELDGPLFLQQVMAKLDIATETEAYEALRKYEKFDLLLRDPVGVAENAAAKAVDMVKGTSTYGMVAPLKSLWDSMSTVNSLTGANEVAGNATELYYDTRATRSVFGDDLTKLSSLTYLDFF
jgi:hypothetical protein